jgi:hypothetical protein
MVPLLKAMSSVNARSSDTLMGAASVILPQSPVGPSAIQASLPSLAGGVVVIVDAPPR